MRLRSRVPAALALLLAATLVAGAPTRAAAPAPPDRIDLPPGFQPEGIAIAGSTAYVGSLRDGSIYAADLSTGEGRRLRRGPGVPAVGLKADGDRLYVAGGPSGTARVLDRATGKVLSTLRLTRKESFVNDVVVARDAVWFTDSAAPRLYRVPFSGRRVPRTADVQVVRLRGQWRQPTAGEFGANGITLTPDRKALLVVNSTAGTLFRVPPGGPRRGVARRVDLGGASLTDGDGLLTYSQFVFVVRNQRNAVVQLTVAPNGTRGSRVRTIRSRDFDVPTTVALKRGYLYLPNARFTTPPRPGTRYSVYRVLAFPQPGG